VILEGDGTAKLRHMTSGEQRDLSPEGLADAIVAELRDAGLAADLDLAERSFKGQMKQADRSGARHAVILEPDGTAKLRDMTSGEQRDVDPAGLAAQLITKLSAR
jgi:histidyl-tRNA synthetase